MPRAINEWWLYISGNRHEATAALHANLPRGVILDTQDLRSTNEVTFVLDAGAPEMREAIRAWQARAGNVPTGPGSLLLVSRHGPRFSDEP